jgi:hypothetical protein
MVVGWEESVKQANCWGVDFGSYSFREFIYFWLTKSLHLLNND